MSKICYTYAVVSKIRIGILGCAKVAEKYAINAFRAIDNAEVIGIASRDSAKASDWASRFGIKSAMTYESLLAANEIDAVYIPLPIGLHKEWAVKAAAAKKHIICEKSLAENLSSAKEIVDACRKNNVVLYENFMCDYHPQHQKTLSLIREGKIGRPFIFNGYFGFTLTDKKNFRFKKDLGGGSLNDAGAYTVFMARKIFGGEPRAVTCRLFYDNEVDTRGVAIMEFPDEMAAHISFSFESVYQNGYSILGGTGLIKVNRAYSIPADMKPTVKLITNENLTEIETAIDVPAANHFELIFHNFCDTIINKEKKTDRIEDIFSKIINQAKTLEALRLSAKEDRKIKLAEIS